MNQLDFCHLKITDIGFDELMGMVQENIKERRFLSITKLTVKLFIKSLFNKKLRAYLNQIDIVIPKSRLLYNLIKKTYPSYQFTLNDGKDFMTPLFKEYHMFSVHFILLGGSSIGLNKLLVNLRNSFHELKIIGTYPKVLLKNRPEETKTVIKKSSPHVLFIGLEEGKEEEWVLENRDILSKTVVFCVNHQIEVMCNDKKDIPFRYKMKNQEYLYHLKEKPYRIFDIFVWGLVYLKWLFFNIKKNKKEKHEKA
ncbi:MAG TPA: hypothetical protein DHW82_11085 [Spirochaetia bacterium]|nr:MAG: hypothetical protein A2Y41_01085 [Spirochaetes bacterium GWB1_36_13]HCL57536.1 hypothetical protein [Spirochaetia bacterium]